MNRLWGCTMIIVEGPDNSGKTTLCEGLANTLEIKVKHSGGPCKEESDFRNRMAKIMIDSNVIYDRVPAISEVIYQPVVRAETDNWIFPIFKEYINRLLELDPILIYCRPPNFVVMDLKDHKVKAHESVEHVDKVKENAFQIILAYDRLMSRLPCLTFDWTAVSPQYYSLLTNYCISQMQHLEKMKQITAMCDLQETMINAYQKKEKTNGSS